MTGTIILFVAGVVTMIGALWLSTQVPQAPREHLCSVAEVSPDVAPRERERCREIRGHKL